MNNLTNKKPIELTNEETYELVKQIAEIEYSRNSNARLYQDVDDGVNEFFTYSLEKDKRGKKGLNNHYKKLSLAHFKNLIHLEIRNSLAYQFRKISVQKTILERDSLDRTAFLNNDIIQLKDTIPDDKDLNQIEEDIELNSILSRIDNSDNNQVYMKVQYGESEITQPFNYRNLTKLYYDYSDNKKLNSNSFKGILFNKQTDEELKDEEIKTLLTDYKSYIKENNILGGTTC